MWSCKFKEVIGVPCPGCGITRALLCLLQLDFVGAFNYNPMIYCYIVSLFIYFTITRKSTRLANWLLWINVIITIIIWLFRLVSGRLESL